MPRTRSNSSRWREWGFKVDPRTVVGGDPPRWWEGGPSPGQLLPSDPIQILPVEAPPRPRNERPHQGPDLRDSALDKGTDQRSHLVLTEGRGEEFLEDRGLPLLLLGQLGSPHTPSLFRSLPALPNPSTKKFQDRVVVRLATEFDFPVTEVRERRGENQGTGPITVPSSLIECVAQGFLEQGEPVPFRGKIRGTVGSS